MEPEFSLRPKQKPGLNSGSGVGVEGQRDCGQGKHREGRSGKTHGTVLMAHV